MNISRHLLFIENDSKDRDIIYNFFTNRVVMVNKRIGDHIKRNIGKKIQVDLIENSNLEILIRNGIIIDDESEYLKKKFVIKYNQKGINVVYLHVTQRCNLNCIYCYNRENLNRKDRLSTEEIKYILRELKSIGVKVINLTGGEALLRDDILELLKEAKSLEFKVALLTNGTLIDEKKEIFNYIDSCIISIDDIDIKTNGTTRKGSDKYNVIKMLCDLPAEYKEKVTVRSVIMRGKEESAERNRKYFEEKGIKYKVNLCLPNNKDEIENMPEVTSDFIDGNKNPMCGAGKTIIAIDSNGDIYPCQTFVGSKYLLGNILGKDWYIQYQENTKHDELINLKLDEKSQCYKCKYKFLCLGGCPNLAYRVYGNIKYTNDFMCDLYKKNIDKYLISMFERKGNVSI